VLLCPCGSGVEFTHCCQPFIDGTSIPVSCEQLMRSRYSAFALSNARYLWQSHHPDYRQGAEPTVPSQPEDLGQWEKLTIVFSSDFVNGQDGMVEFKAYYRENQQLQILHERSNFKKVAGRWFYTDGEFAPKALGRNSMCPCGSGKKFKQCCNKS